jgi:ribosomal protein S18 acetylase RimI-like enzyme
MKDRSINIQRIFDANKSLYQQIELEMDEGLHWDKEQAKLFFADKNNALFVAFLNEKVVGFLTAYRLQRFDSERAEVLIYEISVSEEHRRKGIGKKLMQAVKTWAKEVSADEAWVLTYSSNLPAMALYKSEGGEEDEPGTRMFSYKV